MSAVELLGPERYVVRYWPSGTPEEGRLARFETLGNKPPTVVRKSKLGSLLVFAAQENGDTHAVSLELVKDVRVERSDRYGDYHLVRLMEIDRMKTKRKTVDFSPAECEIIARAARAVWNEIGSDVLAVCEEEGEGEPGLAEMVEVVCDAGRLEEEIARRGAAKYGYGLSPEEAKALAAKVRDAGDVLEEIVKAALR